MILELRARYVLILIAAVFWLSACAGDSENTQETPEATSIGSVERGEQLILNYGCGACHTIPGITGADTLVGPPLTHFARRSYIAGVMENTPENLIAWIQNPQTVQPDTVMPNLGVNEADARDVAAYLLSLD